MKLMNQQRKKFLYSIVIGSVESRPFEPLPEMNDVPFAKFSEKKNKQMF